MGTNVRLPPRFLNEGVRSIGKALKPFLLRGIIKKPYLQRINKKNEFRRVET